MARSEKAPKDSSRRDFLRMLPLGLAGAVGLGLLSGRTLYSRYLGRRRPPNFPADSIFAPAKDNRTDL